MPDPAWAEGRLFDVWTPDECKAGKCSQKPCKPKNHGKHPRAGGWQGATYEGSGNVGLRTGSGIGVLDVDDLEGLAILEDRIGPLPKGPRVRTGSGGLHVYFDVGAAQLGNRTKFSPGLDWRGDGGYAVFPPSVHASGNAYEAADFDLPLPECPASLVDMVKTPSATAAARATSGFDVDKFLKNADPCIEGQGGSKQLWHVTMTLVEKGCVRDWDTFKRTIAEYNSRCQPPWPEDGQDGLRRQFERALSDYADLGLVDVPRGRDGMPSKSYAAILDIVRNDETMQGRLRLNLLGDRPEFDGRGWEDSDADDIAVHLMERYGWDNLSDGHVDRACRRVMRENAYHPARDYFDALTWDGTERLDDIAETVLGADSELASVQVAQWMAATVARQFNPGLRFDHVLFLKGAQGLGKSSFGRLLCSPIPGGFDENPVDLKDKDGRMQVGRCVVYAFDDLATAFRAVDVNAAKNFLSRTTDIYRPPFERAIIEKPRSVTFMASTNDATFLHDVTGSRRFWVIDTKGVVPLEGTTKLIFDLDWLAANCDQLWAEAVQRYRKLSFDLNLTDHQGREALSKRLGLPPRLDVEREAVNATFQDADPIFDAACDHLDDMRGDPAYPGWTRLHTVLQAVVGNRNDQRATRSVQRALEDRGFVQGRKRVGPELDKRGYPAIRSVYLDSQAPAEQGDNP